MWYYVLVEGRNIYLKDADDGLVSRFGCFGSRVILASTEQEAGDIAMKMASDELSNIAANGPVDPIELSVDEVSFANEDLIARAPIKGFTFYDIQDDVHKN